MPYGVTMFVDEETEQTIRSLWKAIGDKGITSYMLDNNVRPHITVAVYEEIDELPFLNKFEEFVKEYSPISFSLSSVGTFLGQPGTVFIAPTVTHRLMNIHSRFHEEFHELEHSLSGYSLPGIWFPHITLAVGLEKKQEIFAVIEKVLDAELPDHSRIEEIGIGEFAYNDDRTYTVQWLYNFPL